MRAIEFDPKSLGPEQQEWWQKFEKTATQATQATVKAWETWLTERETPRATPAVDANEFSYKFRERIWRDLKKWLFEPVFHGKCAYCESTLTLDRYLGDAEHYRPKGQVTVDKEGVRWRVRTLLYNGEEIEHPGYFWLAYDWRNLMPACSFCNSGRAKNDRFPAAQACLMVRLSAAEKAALIAQPLESAAFPGHYYLAPADLDVREQPKLLNPVNPDPDRTPARHLRFGVGGDVVALDRSEIGEHSIECYELKRDVLRRRRQKMQENIRRIYFGTLQDPGVDIEERLRAKLADFLDGKEEYSAAAIDYLDVVRTLQNQATSSLFARVRR